MTQTLTLVLFVLIAVSRSIAATGNCWGWGAARIGGMGIDGGLAWSYDLSTVKLPSGEEIHLQVVLRSPESFGHTAGTGIEWSVPQITSSLAPRKGGRWAWRAPDGTQWIFEPPFATDGASLITDRDGSGCVASPDGWRFFYERGALRRIMSPAGVVLRVAPKGAKLHRIELGPVSRPTILLSVQYSPVTGQVQSIETPGGLFSFLKSGTGAPLAIIDQHGADLIRLSYVGDVVNSITTAGNDVLPVIWRKLHFWEGAERLATQRDFVLAELGTEEYDFSVTQADTTIQMKTGTKRVGLIYNHYSHQVKFGELP